MPKMIQLANRPDQPDPPDPSERSASSRSRRLKKHVHPSRPALTDLRLAGVGEVVDRGEYAEIWFGPHRLVRVLASKIDVPSLHRVLSQIRVSQARRKRSKQPRLRTTKILPARPQRLAH